MIDGMALAGVAVAGFYLVVLGGAAFVAPSLARRFLLGFAATPTRHYAEMAARLCLGAAFVIAAPALAFSGPFRLFGWVLLATTLVLVLVPWRWHDRFARRVVPEALRFLPLLAVCSASLGALVLWAAWRGSAA